MLSAVEHQSGSALRFRGIAGALARRGFEVHLLEPAPAGEAAETPEAVRRHPCPRLPGSPAWQAPLWLLHGLAAVLRVRPDTVYVLKALPNVWLPALVGRALGARVAVDLDDLDQAYYRRGPVRWLVERFFRWALQAADDITTHNDVMRRLVAEKGGRTRSAIFVDQGIDVFRFREAAESPGLRARLGLGAGPVILYAGHLGPASYLGPLLPALAEIARERPGANLLVVGDGSERERFEGLAGRWLPPGFAVFAGSVAHRDVAGYYALADVAVNYLAANEANRYRASIKTREALAAGVPVVASRAADNERFREYIRLVDGDDVASFVRELGEELARPGRERARAGAAWLARHGTFAAAVAELARAWGARGEDGAEASPQEERS
jgi:glycosyltransferase involved in cell wall biosynthesis